MAKQAPQSAPTAPTGAKEKKARPRQPRVPFEGGKRNEDGKLTEVPDEWNAVKHKPLKTSDFVDETMWYELKARQYEKKAQWFRTAATADRAAGKAKDKSKAKQLVKLQRQLSELKAALAAAGEDVEGLLAAASAKADADVEKIVAAPAA